MIHERQKIFSDFLSFLLKILVLNLIFLHALRSNLGSAAHFLWYIYPQKRPLGNQTNEVNNMNQKEWEALPKDTRDLIITAFKMAGRDFERDMIAVADPIPDETSASPWMTRAEAARYAHVSTDTIDNWCRAKYIERAKLGTGKAGGVLILRESLEKFLWSRIDNRAKRIRNMAPSAKGGYRVQRAK